jgi:hypothetical protein
MTKFQEHNKEAERIGTCHGRDAASWYWDNTEPSEAVYQRVLQGISDGDPQIMDTLPHAVLSGENADDMTPARLYELIGITDERWITYTGQELCDTYEEAFNSAVSEAVEQTCIENLRRSVKVVIEADIELVTPETLSRWAQGIADAAAESQHVSIDDTYVVEQGADEGNPDERIW